MKKIKRIKKLDTSWLLLVLAGTVLGAYIFNSAAGLDLAIYIYKCAAVILLLGLFPVIGFGYNHEEILKLMNRTITTDVARKRAMNKFSNHPFLNFPILLHMCCGIWFTALIDDIYLALAFLGILFYLRVMYFLISVITVRHLEGLDWQDEDCE